MLAQGWVLYHTRIRLKSCSGTLHSFQSTKTLIESELLEPNSRLQFIADRRDGGGGCSSAPVSISADTLGWSGRSQMEAES